MVANPLSITFRLACAQYAVPLLQNSLDEIANLNLIGILERVLKLSTISLVCWLAGFFALFQSALNLLAEVMMFGDREFYGDWWNSSDLRSYWTSWNKPVTHFMKRHIYAPMVGRGVPPVAAQIITFLFSGLLHELLVGVPTHNILGVAFLGMVAQIPLIFLTDPLSRMTGHNGKLAGNLIFWMTVRLPTRAMTRDIVLMAPSSASSANRLQQSFTSSRGRRNSGRTTGPSGRWDWATTRRSLRVEIVQWLGDV